jgi:hypothetical protein
MKYKVTNLLECSLKFKEILFAPRETKILDEAPPSDKFHVEKTEEIEKKQKIERRKE